MSRPTLTHLPTLDGTRATTDARLAAWLGDGSAEVVEDAVAELTETLTELVDVARSRASLKARSDEADELHGLGLKALRTIESVAS